MNCKINKYLIQSVEEDIQNYSPTVMFRGTPCISNKHLTNSFVTLSILHMTFNFAHDFQFCTWLSVLHMTFSFAHDFQFCTRLSVLHMTFSFAHDFQFCTWLSILHMTFSYTFEHKHNAKNWIRLVTFKCLVLNLIELAVWVTYCNSVILNGFCSC